MHRNDKRNVLKHAVLAAAMASALLAVPFATHAAGMGKITVLSALGQPLRAELDISASREEMGSLAARVAPVEAFRQANVEYASVLPSVRFTLDKRSDGKPYFRIETDRAVNDPFIDFLVELNWSAGRLVREYAFLLDPPELKTDSASVALAAPTAPTPVDISAPVSALPEAAVESVQNKKVRRAPVESQKPVISNEVVSASAAGGTTNTRKVKPGDTLGRIAAESAPAGVTLDQMLVALFNSNRDAFIGGNMNRLRAGRILNIPDAEKAVAVSSGEARKVVVVQYAAFNAYRNSLAASAANQVPVEQKAQQSSSGKITPKVEEKSLSANGQDKLSVSHSEAQAKPDKGKLSEADIVARDKALKEANSRIGELEKNLADLKKLAELKEPLSKDTQKAGQAAAKTPAPVEVKPAPSPAVPVPAATPVTEKPQPNQKKKVVPPPPEPEPGFVEENPLLVYGGSSALVAALGFLGFLVWKRRRDSASDQGITVSELAASSVFGTAASENAAADVAAQPDFGHSAFDAIDIGKEGVDPIQEAEVYMAYGRDGQAEEILIDALQKDPGNLAVYLKLLEIYAGRKSLHQFNELAGELHTRTGGNGTEWDRAVVLGRSLDPANLLYTGVAMPEPVSTVASVPAEQSMEATMVMQAPPMQEAPASTSAAPATEEDVSSALDFDLDLGSSAPAAPVAASAAVPVATTVSNLDFDLDLGNSEKPVAEAAQAGGLDINFDAPAKVGNALDFDFDLGESAPASPEHPAPPLDLSSINLDLDEPPSPAAGGNSDDSTQVATKLELAHAYEEMGDHDGARELLQEVLAEGSPAQQEAARSRLAQLG